jgi:hypothetical protein
MLSLSSLPFRFHFLTKFWLPSPLFYPHHRLKLRWMYSSSIYSSSASFSQILKAFVVVVGQQLATGAIPLVVGQQLATVAIPLVAVQPPATGAIPLVAVQPPATGAIPLDI